MAWPSGLDYTEIIQSPHTAFEDADLRAATPECRPPQSGIPYGRSGNFATVFKLLSPARNWAVKCFTKPQDSKDRYAAISERLSKLRSPYMVEFTYLHRGIRVRGQWYPIVKMQWAEGDPLDVYVRKNLSNPQALASLAVKWVQMVQYLEQMSLAHGDLQHGNVLVVNSGIKLVDYDGMFVPALAGMRSSELGQPNYQHPRRTDTDFGPQLDNFSAWVIYVSLVALSIYPNLWQTFRGGDDCLLFRKRDFEDPDQSDVLKALEHCRNHQLRNLVEFFKIALYSSPSDVPSFDNAIQVSTILMAAKPVQALPGWLQDRVTPKPSEPSRRDPTVTAVDHSWVLDFMAPPGPVPAFSSSLILQRVLLYCSIVIAASAALFTSMLFALVSVGLIILNVMVSLRQYKAEPAVISRTQSRLRIREAERELDLVRRILDEREVRKRDLRSVESEQVSKLTKESQSALTEEKKQHETADRVMRQATASALQSKQRIDQQEAAELQQVQGTLAAKVASLAQQLNQSQHAENVQRSNTLQKRQEDYIQYQLERVNIDGAIPGIGRFVINNLAHEGIRTAADCIRLTYVKVPSVGRRRVAVILDWRQQLEAEAKLTMPTALNTSDENMIRTKSASSRALIQSQLSNAQDALKAQQIAIKERCLRSRSPFDSQIAAEKAKHSLEQQRIAAESKRRQEVLQESIICANHKANEAVAQIDKDEAGHRGLLKSVQWCLAKEKVQSRRLETVSYGRYIRRMTIGM